MGVAVKKGDKVTLVLRDAVLCCTVEVIRRRRNSDSEETVDEVQLELDVDYGIATSSGGMEQAS